MTNTDFLGLIHSLTAAAETSLGQFNALTARMNRDGVTRNRTTAERSLRLLEMLVVKTRGNLNLEEAKTLTEAVGSVSTLLANSPLEKAEA
ncbi:MAG: hypothetical protein RLZZ156_252 [Deinococcota bacterium]|jgi:hypothetical protein